MLSLLCLSSPNLSLVITVVFFYVFMYLHTPSCIDITNICLCACVTVLQLSRIQSQLTWALLSSLKEHSTSSGIIKLIVSEQVINVNVSYFHFSSKSKISLLQFGPDVSAWLQWWEYKDKKMHENTQSKVFNGESEANILLMQSCMYWKAKDFQNKVIQSFNISSLIDIIVRKTAIWQSLISLTTPLTFEYIYYWYFLMLLLVVL